MNQFFQYAFNLLFNSMFSFFAGFFIVFGTIRIFKIRDSRQKLFLLTLPFVKILWDLFFRKIPESSVLNVGINPLALPPNHQTLTIGSGFSNWGPIFDLVFTARSLDGKEYSTSGADYLFSLLQKYWGGNVPMFIFCLTLFVSWVFIVRRVVAYVIFERRRGQRRSLGTVIETIPLKYRHVDVYVTDDYEGTPFTGALVRPYICFPKRTWSFLDLSERDAVIKHELAHINNHDLVVTMAIKFLGDLFWFVPGYRYLSRRIDRLREVLADSYAVRSGASSRHLASALLKLKDFSDAAHEGTLYSAFFREKSLLRKRIENLLNEAGEDLCGRWGWNRRVLRPLILLGITASVMLATFGGNHEVAKTQHFPILNRIFKKLGLEVVESRN